MKKLLIFLLCVGAVLAAGAITETFQGSYQSARVIDSNTDDLSLYANHAGDLNDVNAIDLRKTGGERVNVIQFIAGGVGLENDTFRMKLRGYAGRFGPAELIADVNMTLGTQSVVKWPDGDANSSAVWCDTVSKNETAWPTSMNISDSGNNRVGKLSFDAAGYRYMDIAVADVNDTGGADGEPNSIQIWYRYY